MSEQIQGKGIRRNKKIYSLVIIVLALVVRLFFSFIFGENVLAKKQENISNAKLLETSNLLNNIGPESFNKEKPENICSNVKIKEKNTGEKEKNYKKIVENYPLVTMVSEIAKKDKKVAAFLIAIAKKESNWGRHSPKKKGEECYNYWGYRGGYNITESGYSCFDSPKQAISVVGGRIENLISQKVDTPEKMIVWKCGRDCSWDDPAAVKKWIKDVSFYYNNLNS